MLAVMMPMPGKIPRETLGVTGRGDHYPHIVGDPLPAQLLKKPTLSMMELLHGSAIAAGCVTRVERHYFRRTKTGGSRR
jgi:hypothetical protein